MKSDMRQLENLADRARRGDSEAAADLRERLAPRMIHLVRQALRSGQAVFSIDRRILTEARRSLTDNPQQSPPDERLVQEIALRLCDDLGRVSAPAAPLTCCLGETIGA